MLTKKRTIMIIVMSLLAALLFSFTVTAAEQNLWSWIMQSDGTDFNWYEATQERIEACYADGGLSSSYYHNAESKVSKTSITGTEFDVLAYDNTISVQAQRRKILDDVDDAIKDPYLYEVAWYIHPFGENVEYEVYLLKDNGAKYSIEGVQGADIKHGSGGYWAEETNEEYVTIVVEYTQGGKQYTYEINGFVEVDY